MAMGGSLSSQDEVVEAIKVDLQAQEMVQSRLVDLSLFKRVMNLDRAEIIHQSGPIQQIVQFLLRTT